MADKDRQQLEHLRKLLSLYSELQIAFLEKQQVLFEEIDALMNGGVSIGAKLKHVETAWLAAWASRYHGGYVFSYVKDRPHWKRLLRVFSAEELQLRMLNYLRSDDPFYLRNRHSFGLFVTSVNQWGSAPIAAPEAPSAVNCTHTPRCLSDQEHTRRHTDEMRGDV